jgi:hypothetical protein
MEQQSSLCHHVGMVSSHNLSKGTVLELSTLTI